MENINNNLANNTTSTENKFTNKKLTIIALIIIFLFALVYFYLQRGERSVSKNNIITSYGTKDGKERAKRNFDAYYLSLRQNNPMELQNGFLEDIKNGVNDEYTKSSIYFITHRFFDNGGDIYEVYDYVNSHPELAFLKEAESIYPRIFAEISKKKKNFTYHTHLYAYCAYVETLIKYGYGDVASNATVANQYAKLAFFSKMIMSLDANVSSKEKEFRNEWLVKNTDKSLKYITLTEPDIKKILNGEMTEKDIPARDILVGMNQYAASLRYLEAIGVKAPTTISSREVFTFSYDYSFKHVKELVFFTAFLNASTLALISSSTPNEIKTALYPILDFDTKKVTSTNANYNLGILGKIIDAKSIAKPKKLTADNFDIYSKWNIVMLAKKVPEFKKWLINNGWEESDFKY
jgi:hypothetical protein